MFDWNDQELVNVIWGEADNSDDHIVPYPHGSKDIPLDLSSDLNKKEWNKETFNEKPSKQKKPVPANDLNRGKQEKKSQCDRNEVLSTPGHSMDSWINMYPSNVSKPYHNSMDGPATAHNGSQIFVNPNDNKDSDLVDYGWDNIGSFEDLDRIFSNGDPEFGCASLGNADELWPSSKDIVSSPEKFTSLSMGFSSLGSEAPSTSEHCGKSVDKLDQDQPFATGYLKVNDLSCHVPSDMARDSKTLPSNFDHDDESIAVPTELADKMGRKKNLLRRRKRSGEESEATPYQDLYNTPSSSENQFLQHESQYAKSGLSRPSLGITKQMQLQKHESLIYNNVSAPLLSPSVHTRMQIGDPAVPVLPHLHSGFEVPPGKSTMNEFPGSAAYPSTMTPQEKIKKLRRRQQLRAMLAIQKQQKQFGHQTSISQRVSRQKHTVADHNQLLGGNLEVDNCGSTLLSLDTNSPTQHDCSGTISMETDNCSVEDAILCRLQDIVAKLDVKLRLCIRDSLCRLAKSASQRQCAKDTSSTMKRSENYHGFLPEETNGGNRSARMPEAETDTNPIDRTVAHLLFHRPVEFSGNIPETAESPASAMVPRERKATSLLGMPMGVSSAEVEMTKSSFCVNTSENASICGAQGNSQMLH